MSRATDRQQHAGHTHEDIIESGVFEAMEYCHHCGCALNDPARPESREVEPQVCAQCAGEGA